MASTMASTSRRSVRFEVAESSSPPIAGSSRRRRSIAAQKLVEQSSFEENDDEAERLARRERNESTSSIASSKADKRQSSFGLSSISNITAAEMSNQIAQCIKLNAENKINDKNAFQLKMIDFLVYALKKQDPNMSNLQMATASLDASAKIYGFRVDKVYSDLLKIIGIASREKKENQGEENVENVEENNENTKKVQQKEKKKKKQQNILNTEQGLKGSIDTCNPWSLIRCQRDTQTSDMLFQAGLPQHANQGISLNLYRDTCLDKIPTNVKAPFIVPVKAVVSNVAQEISPSYASFQFIGWSPDDEPEEPNDDIDDNDGRHHFDLDGEVPQDDFVDNTMMDCGDAYEERCDRLAENNRVENIVDFQDIIANNPNPNATYEYSYIQKSYRIHWAGPSHWKITLNRHAGTSKVVETCKQKAGKKSKEIDLCFIEDWVEQSKLKFRQINKPSKLVNKSAKQSWSEEKITFPEHTDYVLKRFYTFFNKPSEILKSAEKSVTEEDKNDENDDMGDIDCNDGLDMSNLEAPVDAEHFENNHDDGATQDFNPEFTQETVTQTQGAFIGDNLVAAPKVTDKIFIPYSQRAKKIDMRQLKKTMWKNLKNSKETEKENVDISQSVLNENNNEIQPKEFSSVYLDLPKQLTKTNADSLSPAIAFMSLLHLANEKNLVIDRNLNLSDLTIKGKL